MCPSCGSLVGVRDDKCYSCGRANPGLWGFGPALRKIGVEFGFGNVVIGACITLYAITLLMSGNAIFQVGGGIMSLLAPKRNRTGVLGASRDITPSMRIAVPDVSSVMTYSVTQAPMTTGPKPKSAPRCRSIGPNPHNPGFARPHE